MAVIVDPDIPLEFVLPEDRKKPKKDQTVFRLKPLTGREFAKLAGSLALAQENPEKIYDLLRVTLIGWDRLKNSSGSEVEYTSDAVDLLPIDIASVLADAAIKLAGLTPEEAGN